MGATPLIRAYFAPYMGIHTHIMLRFSRRVGTQARKTTAAIVDDHRRCAALVRKKLAAAGIDCVHLNHPTGADDFVTNADIVLVSKSRIGKTQLDHCMPRAKLLIRMGVGYDNVDLPACDAAGVTVCNVNACTEEVADAAFSHVLNHLRQTARAAHGAATARATAGLRERLAAEGVAARVRGRTLGLVGLGRIGRAVAARSASFGLRALYHDPAVAASPAVPAARVGDLRELLRRSDVVSLHCTAQADGPLANLGMMDARAFARMRPGAALVNTARGDLIDPAALTAALRDDGRRLFAYLDCAPGEPFERDEGWLGDVSDLLGTRLILTPHCAWFSREVENQIADLAFETCVRWCRGEC